MKHDTIKKILCMRPDNMGDILMSTPAIKALKDSFNAHITLLASSAGAGIADYIPEIDETIVADLPWAKHFNTPEGVNDIVQELKSRSFDLAVIFTVFSQSPLPSAMLAWMAGIPNRLAYCRENPYNLLTHWVPDDEPLEYIVHQVHRDLKLVASIGARTLATSISLSPKPECNVTLTSRLNRLGISKDQPLFVMHCGTTDVKREYPVAKWIEIGEQILEDPDRQLLLTGGPKELREVSKIEKALGNSRCFNLAGQLNLGEFISLIEQSDLVLTVNSLPVHIASALKKPVVVLYAKTNPQHTPWQTSNKVLYFDVPPKLRSDNRILHFITRTHLWEGPDASVANVMQAVESITGHTNNCSAVVNTFS